MLGIEEIKETRLGKELLTEGKLEAVPEILARGFTIEAVAEILKLEVEQVRQVAEKEKRKVLTLRSRFAAENS